MSRSTVQSTVLLDCVMENCSAIITIKDLNCNYIACNKAFFETFGIEKDITGKNLYDVFGNEIYSVIYHYIEKLFATGEMQSFTIRVQDKIISQTISPIYQDGSIKSVMSLSYDVTFEENLKLKFLDKISNFNTLLEYIPMLVYMNDKDHNYITGSKYSKKFLDTGIDTYSNGVQLNIDDYISIMNKNDIVVSETKAVLIKEIQIPTIDGQLEWYKIYKIPVLDYNNYFNGIVTIAQNINIEKNLEMQKELFLATLTHDLKNPVQAQLLSLKMFSNGAFGDLTQEQKEMLDMIFESANYMHEMLQSILGTYKYDNGVIELEKCYFSAEDLILNCINEVKAFAMSKNISIKTKFQTCGAELFADAKQLRRVVSNLLNNALNYSFRETDLKISVKNDGVNMIFEFENSSLEIPDEIKTTMFEKYVSGAKNYKLTGIGLGLYFSKKVVEAHNGKIYLQGKGTSNKFIFEIPLHNSQKTFINW